MYKEKQHQCDMQVKRKQLEALLGEVSEKELEMHFVHSSGYFPQATISLEIDQWYSRLLKENKKKHLYVQRKLKMRIEKTKMLLVYSKFKNSDLSIRKKVQLFINYIPVTYYIEALLKMIIWSR